MGVKYKTNHNLFTVLTPDLKPCDRGVDNHDGTKQGLFCILSYVHFIYFLLRTKGDYCYNSFNSANKLL